MGPGRPRARQVSRRDLPFSPSTASEHRGMSFLIDTDTCSAYLKGDRRVFNRFLQYTGALHISLITVAELHVWALRLNAPANRIQDLNGLLQQGILLQVTRNVAYKYGEVQAGLMDA